MEIFFPVSSRGDIKRIRRIFTHFCHFCKLQKPEKFVNRSQSKGTPCNQPLNLTHFPDKWKETRRTFQLTGSPNRATNPLILPHSRRARSLPLRETFFVLRAFSSSFPILSLESRSSSRVNDDAVQRGRNLRVLLSADDRASPLRWDAVRSWIEQQAYGSRGCGRCTMRRDDDCWRAAVSFWRR